MGDVANPDQLAHDKPETDPTRDRLGYAPFARHLAVAIRSMAPEEGLVMAIYGPWGSGKTTLLNFVRYFLSQAPRGEPLVIEFNPWWFSGTEDLTRRFFDQLLEELDQQPLISNELR
ncbi:MAG TPA: P-loop NTPase fold protein, partial [Jatrophihabitantaceae bacterium]|nr:P-loop NTPase fold protein [Jatrophihabitantaceae bacterium]